MQAEANLSILYSKWSLHPEINNQTINNILEITLIQFNSLKKLQCINTSILLTNDRYMRSLNNKYLHKNKPTNVLSFPKFAFNYKTLDNLKLNQEVMFLGDILFGYQTLVKEAKDLSISVLEHFAHLLIHGTLHLLGFDHKKEDEAEVMESLEESILSKFHKTLFNNSNA